MRTPFQSACLTARIVYRGDANVLHVMGADGGQHGPIGNPPVVGGYPSFSPDGTMIAFHSNRDGNLDIYAARSRSP